MTRKMLMAALLMAAFAQGTQAQDLSGQRSEKQDVNMIPGKKLDHHGLIVSPTPHLLNVDAANRLDLQKGNRQERQVCRRREVPYCQR